GYATWLRTLPTNSDLSTCGLHGVHHAWPNTLTWSCFNACTAPAISNLCPYPPIVRNTKTRRWLSLKKPRRPLRTICSTAKTTTNLLKLLTRTGTALYPTHSLLNPEEKRFSLIRVSSTS